MPSHHSIGPSGTVLCNSAATAAATGTIASLNRSQRDRTLQPVSVQGGLRDAFVSQSVPAGPYFATQGRKRPNANPYKRTVSIGPSGTVLCNKTSMKTKSLTMVESQSVPAGPYFATLLLLQRLVALLLSQSSKSLWMTVCLNRSQRDRTLQRRDGNGQTLILTNAQSQSVPAGPYFATKRQ